MFFGQHWLVVSVMLSWNDNVNPVVCTMVGSSAPRENTTPPQVFTSKRETFSKCISWTANQCCVKLQMQCVQNVAGSAPGSADDLMLGSGKKGSS